MKHKRKIIFGTIVLLALLVGAMWGVNQYAYQNPCSKPGRTLNRCVQGDELLGPLKFVRTHSETNQRQELTIRPNGEVHYADQAIGVVFEITDNEMFQLVQTLKQTDFELLLDQPEPLIYQDRHTYHFEYMNQNYYINDEPERWEVELAHISELVRILTGYTSQARAEFEASNN